MRMDMSAPAIADFEQHRRQRLLRERTVSLIGLAVFSVALYHALHVAEFLGTERGDDPLARIALFLERLVPTLHGDKLLDDAVTEGSLAYWFYGLPRWLRALFETIEMAIAATVFGSAFAIGASFLAARNTMPFVSVRFFARRTLEIIRTVPDLILALILVAAFGVGPLAGALALTLGTMGSLGRLFAEATENIDPKPVEAVKAVGGGWFNQLRYGVWPQVAPNHISYAFITFEGNIGRASALGIIGAGGIGMELQRAITYTLYDTYLAIALLIVCTIFVADMTSEAIRHRLFGAGDRT